MNKPVSPLSLWPLVVILEDVHIPEYAEHVVAAVETLTAQEAALTITLAIDRAAWDTGRVNRRIRRWR